MPASSKPATYTPPKGKVFPGTWPDCPDCHGTGHQDKERPDIPCQTCQEKSAAISHSLNSLIEFDYYGRPRNHVNFFPRPGEKVKPTWKDITWAEAFNGVGVNAGTWPDCPRCSGMGIIRYESSWDGHRSDYEWGSCGDCQHRTHEFHAEHPNEKDLLSRRHSAELIMLQMQQQAELKALQARHQAELDALPY